MANKHTKNAHLHEPSEKCKPNHIETHLIPVGVAVIKKKSNSKCSSVKIWTKGKPYTLLLSMQTSPLSMKISEEISQKHKSGLNLPKELSQHKRETHAYKCLLQLYPE